MTQKRFTELLNGPLHHPLVLFRITRLSLALYDVVLATGKAGEEALERHCREREESDRIKGGMDI
jgi:hypothetical protein